MWKRFVVWIIRYALSRSRFSLVERNEIMTHILDNLRASPIRSIITTNEGGEILLNGRSLDIKKIKLLRESARLALENPALKLINEQVLFIAVTGGLHKAIIPEDLYFYRAAIWSSQQIEAQLKILAQRTEDTDY